MRAVLALTAALVAGGWTNPLGHVTSVAHVTPVVRGFGSAADVMPAVRGFSPAADVMPVVRGFSPAGPGRENAAERTPSGVLLESLRSMDVEKHLPPDAVVLIPVGSSAQPHAPHLPLNADRLLVEALRDRILAQSRVIAAPTVTWPPRPRGPVPAGAMTLEMAASRDLIAESCRTLARSGPRRCFLLHAGHGAGAAIAAAREALAAEGLSTDSVDVLQLAGEADIALLPPGWRPEGDQETSLLLYLEPAAVDMSGVAASEGPVASAMPAGAARAPLPGAIEHLAMVTADRGRAMTEKVVARVVSDVERLRRAPVPPPSPPRTMRAAAGGPAESTVPPDGTPGDARAILHIADLFQAAWARHDAWGIAELWTEDGDIIHPDGQVERGQHTIAQNRTHMFTRREYHGSRHPVRFGPIRFVQADVAVVDGLWELRWVRDSSGQELPDRSGGCAVIVKREGGAWRIAAWRYWMADTDQGSGR